LAAPAKAKKPRRRGDNGKLDYRVPAQLY